MKKELVYGISGLVIGAVLAGLITFVVTNKNESATSNSTNHTTMTMADMTNALKGEAGDDFDKAFISGMIEHHQGAIDMAKLAHQNAKHGEVKKMADDIISAQSKEIAMMKSWQAEWGYAGNSGMEGMSH